MIYTAEFEGQRVKLVRGYEDENAVPVDAVVVSNWPDVCTTQFEGAELRTNDGMLYWYDPRTLAERQAIQRAKRDDLLNQTDWIVTRAFERGQAVPAPWVTFRQALRDVTSQPGFPGTIDWPVEPNP